MYKKIFSKKRTFYYGITFYNVLRDRTNFHNRTILFYQERKNIQKEKCSKRKIILREKHSKRKMFKKEKLFQGKIFKKNNYSKGKTFKRKNVYLEKYYILFIYIYKIIFCL